MWPAQVTFTRKAEAVERIEVADRRVAASPVACVGPPAEAALPRNAR